MGSSGKVSAEARLELRPEGREGTGHGRIQRMYYRSHSSEHRSPGDASAGSVGGAGAPAVDNPPVGLLVGSLCSRKLL